jgi:hypothetical protein
MFNDLDRLFDFQIRDTYAKYGRFYASRSTITSLYIFKSVFKFFNFSYIMILKYRLTKVVLSSVLQLNQKARGKNVKLNRDIHCFFCSGFCKSSEQPLLNLCANFCFTEARLTVCLVPFLGSVWFFPTRTNLVSLNGALLSFLSWWA